MHDRQPGREGAMDGRWICAWLRSGRHLTIIIIAITNILIILIIIAIIKIIVIITIIIVLPSLQCQVRTSSMPSASTWSPQLLSKSSSYTSKSPTKINTKTNKIILKMLIILTRNFTPGHHRGLLFKMSAKNQQSKVNNAWIYNLGYILVLWFEIFKNLQNYYEMTWSNIKGEK